jgi:hypothetical protein
MRLILPLVLLATAALGATAARAGVIPPELEKLEDDVGVIEQSRRLLTRMVDKGDLAAAREVLAFLRLRVDWKRYRVFTDVEETLLGSLLGDFDFLGPIKGRPPAEEPACCGEWRDGLLGGLLAKAGQARQTAKESRSLGAVDKEFVDLLIFTILESRGPGDDSDRLIAERGEAYLARFPETPYRPFLFANHIIVCWKPFFALNFRLYGVQPFLDHATDSVFRKRAGIRPGLALGATFGRNITLELHVVEIATAPRRELTIKGRVWPEGVPTALSTWAVMLGYQREHGRHGLQLALGLGSHHMKYKFGEGEHDSSSFSTFAGAAALEYKIDVLRSSRSGRGFATQDYGLLLYARAGVQKAFVTREGVSPAVFLLQLGIGFDARGFRRVGPFD